MCCASRLGTGTANTTATVQRVWVARRRLPLCGPPAARCAAPSRLPAPPAPCCRLPAHPAQPPGVGRKQQSVSDLLQDLWRRIHHLQRRKQQTRGTARLMKAQGFQEGAPMRHIPMQRSPQSAGHSPWRSRPAAQTGSSPLSSLRVAAPAAAVAWHQQRRWRGISSTTCQQHDMADTAALRQLATASNWLSRTLTGAVCLAVHHHRVLRVLLLHLRNRRKQPGHG